MERPAQFRDPQLETTGEIIGFYPREFYVFDNFAAFQVDYIDFRWPTSEHAYHATKFVNTAPDVVEMLQEARSPHDALRIAREHKPRQPEDWDERKVAVMYEICRLKLLQNSYVLQKLELSGDLEIVEDSPKDDFWGWGPNRDGRNELGKIWMKLRDELREGLITPERP
jgi:ribA/ribD-fused uncharacterized protein